MKEGMPIRTQSFTPRIEGERLITPNVTEVFRSIEGEMPIKLTPRPQAGYARLRGDINMAQEGNADGQLGRRETQLQEKPRSDHPILIQESDIRDPEARYLLRAFKERTSEDPSLVTLDMGTLADLYLQMQSPLEREAERVNPELERVSIDARTLIMKAVRGQEIPVDKFFGEVDKKREQARMITPQLPPKDLERLQGVLPPEIQRQAEIIMQTDRGLEPGFFQMNPSNPNIPPQPRGYEDLIADTLNKSQQGGAAGQTEEERLSDLNRGLQEAFLRAPADRKSECARAMKRAWITGALDGRLMDLSDPRVEAHLNNFNALIDSNVDTEALNTFFRDVLPRLLAGTMRGGDVASEAARRGIANMTEEDAVIFGMSLGAQVRYRIEEIKKIEDNNLFPIEKQSRLLDDARRQYNGLRLRITDVRRNMGHLETVTPDMQKQFQEIMQEDPSSLTLKQLKQRTTQIEALDLQKYFKDDTPNSEEYDFQVQPRNLDQLLFRLMSYAGPEYHIGGSHEIVDSSGEIQYHNFLSWVRKRSVEEIASAGMSEVDLLSLTSVPTYFAQISLLEMIKINQYSRRKRVHIAEVKDEKEKVLKDEEGNVVYKTSWDTQVDPEFMKMKMNFLYEAWLRSLAHNKQVNIFTAGRNDIKKYMEVLQAHSRKSIFTDSGNVNQSARSIRMLKLARRDKRELRDYTEDEVQGEVGRAIQTQVLLFNAMSELSHNTFRRAENYKRRGDGENGEIIYGQDNRPTVTNRNLFIKLLGDGTVTQDGLIELGYASDDAEKVKEGEKMEKEETLYRKVQSSDGEYLEPVLMEKGKIVTEKGLVKLVREQRTVIKRGTEYKEKRVLYRELTDSHGQKHLEPVVIDRGIDVFWQSLAASIMDTNVYYKQQYKEYVLGILKAEKKKTEEKFKDDALLESRLLIVDEYIGEIAKKDAVGEGEFKITFASMKELSEMRIAVRERAERTRLTDEEKDKIRQEDAKTVRDSVKEEFLSKLADLNPGTRGSRVTEDPRDYFGFGKGSNNKKINNEKFALAILGTKSSTDGQGRLKLENLNIFNEADIPKDITTYVEDAISDAVCKNLRLDSDEVVYAKGWAKNLAQYFIVDAKQETGSRAFVAPTRFMNFQAFRENQTNKNEIGNPQTLRGLKHVMLSMFDALRMRPLGGDDFTKTLAEVLQGGEGSEVDLTQMKYQKFECPGDAENRYAGIHFLNAVDFGEFIRHGQGFEFEKNLHYDYLGRLVVEPGFREKVLGEIYKNCRYIEMTKIPYAHKIRSWRKDPEHKGDLVFEDITVAQHMFGPELLKMGIYDEKNVQDSQTPEERRIWGSERAKVSADGSFDLAKNILMYTVRQDILEHINKKSTVSKYSDGMIQLIREFFMTSPEKYVTENINNDEATLQVREGRFLTAKQWKKHVEKPIGANFLARFSRGESWLDFFGALFASFYKGLSSTTEQLAT